jgi:hypothetical protein
VSALNKLGLGKLAPGAVGDFFPDQTGGAARCEARHLLRRRAASPLAFLHGIGPLRFLDQDENQVDDGTYVTVDSNTIMIEGATFDYSIDGDKLTDDQGKAALSNLRDFTRAGWMVAVTYPGTTWNRMACQDWC